MSKKFHFDPIQVTFAHKTSIKLMSLSLLHPKSVLTCGNFAHVLQDEAKFPCTIFSCLKFLAGIVNFIFCRCSRQFVD